MGKKVNFRSNILNRILRQQQRKKKLCSFLLTSRIFQQVFGFFLFLEWGGRNWKRRTKRSTRKSSSQWLRRSFFWGGGFWRVESTTWPQAFDFSGKIIYLRFSLFFYSFFFSFRHSSPLFVFLFFSTQFQQLPVFTAFRRYPCRLYHTYIHSIWTDNSWMNRQEIWSERAFLVPCSIFAASQTAAQ